MAEHNLLKKLSIGIASLALICPLAMSGLNTNVNARRRRPRTHRVYRHHRRTRRATRRRRGRRAKRTRKARRSHRRVVRKAKRRPRIMKAHKARRSHKHYANYDNYANDVAPRPVYHHRNTLAQWYKVNGGKLYANENGAGTDFNNGFGDSTVDDIAIQSDNLDNAQYKQGWIDGASLNLNNDTSSLSGTDNDIINALNNEPESYYAHAINVWNSGHHYANRNSFDGEPIYYQGGYSWRDI